MMTPEEEKLRYPIGRLDRNTALTREDAIAVLAALPSELRKAVEGLSEAQLDTAYREGGWTVRQVVHHLADSHAQAVSRIRFALTEDWPRVPDYPEALWAELADARTSPVEDSLRLLEGLHGRLVMLLQSLSREQWQRGFDHAKKGRMLLADVAVLYAWHSQHHLAHIRSLRERKGW